jgi:quinol monooxygenase YgiN
MFKEGININSREISFYTNFHVKEDHLSNWITATRKLIDSMADDRNFHSAVLHVDGNDSTHFTLYERWHETSMEIHIANRLKKNSYRVRYDQITEAMLNKPKTVVCLTAVYEFNK